MNAITLTRDEAAAVAMSAFDYTTQLGSGDAGYTQRADCYAAIHRLQLEATIRDGGGWWGDDGNPDDGNPDVLDLVARMSGTHCPESFEMSAAGMSAIAELLPEMYAETTALHAHYVAGNEHEEDIAHALKRVRALEGLAARLGVNVPQPVA